MNAHLQALKRELVYECKLCGGEEWVDQKKCVNSKHFSAAVELSCAGVPLSHIMVKEDDFKDFVKYPFHEKVLKYGRAIKEAQENGLGILISGPYRTGKSYSAAYIMRCAYERGLSTQFITGLALAQLYNSPKDDVQQSEFDYKFFDKHVVVIDDLGKEIIRTVNSGEWQAFLDSLLRYRAENQKTTVISTNIASADLFAKTYGASIRAVLRHSFDTINIDSVSPIDKIGHEKWSNIIG